MSKRRFNYRKMTALCAVLATLLIQVATASIATTSPSPAAFTEVDLSSEGRALDAFVNDLITYDKRSAELGRKLSLTRAEFDSHLRTADDLKRRVSSVQNALREAIRKLKAAGQWDNLDQTVLARVSDARFQDFVRREGFKRILEEAASGLSNDATQISSPLDALRNKVTAQSQESIYDTHNSALASRRVRVAYTAEPVMFGLRLRCRLASIRVGLSGAFRGPVGGQASPAAAAAYNCYCFGAGCDGAQPE